MTYWILTTEYPPQYGGGIGTYCYHTANMLAEKGHAVTVFMYDAYASGDHTYVQEKVRIVRFVPNKTVAGRFLGFNAHLSYEYAKVVEDYIKAEGKPDIIESQEYQGIAYYLQQFHWLGYKPFHDLKILVTCHAPSFICLEYNQVPVYQLPEYWIGQMEKASIAGAGMLVCPSQYIAGQLKTRMKESRFTETYIANPVPVRNDNDVPAYREKYIVCYGKLSPLKGSFELLRYFKSLWDDGFNYPLHIIGGVDQVFHPEERTMGDIVKIKYKSYINKGLLKLEGNLSPEKAREKIIAAHVVIVPSTFDNLPYTVLEAMSWGKLVLASRQGGQSEIISHGKNGFLFDHFKNEDFSNKLKEILSLSKADIIAIGLSAKKTVWENFRSDVVYDTKIKKIEAFLNQEQGKTQFPFIHLSECRPTHPEMRNENDLLSIVIPFYNLGNYLEECIKSVINSDYPNKEIIIVDDGSNDNDSIQQLNEVESKYPVKVIRKKNEGLPATRNLGAKIAAGKYIAFLDADDTVDQSYYSKAISVLQRYENVHFAGCWIKYFGNSDGHWPSFNPEPPYILFHNTVNSSSLVFIRESFCQYGLNATEMIYGMEDWDSVINMVKNGCYGVILPELLFNYRVRHNSMARSFTRTKMLYLYKTICERHKELFNKHGYEIAQLFNANGSSLYIDNPTFESANNNIIHGINLPSQLKNKLKQMAKRNRFTRKISYTIYKIVKQ